MSIHPGSFHPLDTESIAAMCEGKGAFASAKQAHKVAKRRKWACDVYRCQSCGHFHLGTPSARATKGHPLNGNRRGVAITNSGKKRSLK